MHFLTADIIFPIHQPPVRNGILILDSAGKILDLLDPAKNEIPVSMEVKQFNGILCPGFVNTHCHLELSHLKGKFSQKKKLPYFIGEVFEKRNADPEEIVQAMSAADAEMFNEGMVAIGDISNTNDSLPLKTKSKIYYHTFIELFDVSQNRTEQVFTKGESLLKEFTENGLNATLVPHAPYTVTNGLMKLISDEAKKTGSILSIHNQETASENEMFERGSGELIEKLQLITSAYSRWIPTGKSSLASILPFFAQETSLQLVHNTFTTRADIQLANQRQRKLFWCICANANRFIENRLPDIALLAEEKCRISVGTDSYASNTSLSMIHELQTIQDQSEKLKLDEMLQWATLNGAAFLNLDKRYGSFEKGKQPGVNHISHVDLDRMILTSNSMVRRLL